MKSMNLVLALIAMEAVGLLAAAEPKSAAKGPVIAPPKVELPPVPPDGSGCYRLTLSGWDGHGDPMLVYLDVRGAKVTSAFARGFAQFDESFMSVDASDLTVAGNQLRGKLTVVLPGLRPWGEYANPFAMPEKKITAPLDPPARGSLTVALDLPAGSARHEGACRGTVTTVAGERQPEKRKEHEFVVRLSREPFPPVGKQVRMSLYLPFGLGPTYIFPQIAVLAEVEGGTSTQIIGSWACNNNHHHRISFPVTGALTLADGRLSGRVEVRAVTPAMAAGGGAVKPQQLTPVVMDISAVQAGRWLGGTATATVGDKTWHSACLGRWRATGWPIPLEMPAAKWTWQHDVAPDPALAAEAKREALNPAMEGVPGTRGFWTWRKLLWQEGGVNSIRPVNFDFREVPGAIGYRFSATPKQGKVTSVAMDKPWRPLTELWSGVPVNTPCRLTFEALDAQGKVIATTLKMGILGKESALPEEKEMQFSWFLRKAPFQGPYTTAPRDLRAAALTAGRWSGETPAHPVVTGMNMAGYLNPFNNGGEAGSSWNYAGYICGLLARRALAPDAAERACAEEMLDVFLDALAINQAGAKPKDVFYAYKGNVPLARFGGEAALDAWVEAGDARGKKMAELLGAGLAAAQSTHGSWPVKGLGYFGWKAGLGDWSKQGWRDWSAAEMLYILGRIRRDCQTERFREAEDRAYRFVMEQQVAGMFWPMSDHHSFTWAYPIPPHSQAAMYFIRYLVELAPPERRDLPLAEELALWCEDLDVDWSRREGSQSGAILPRVSRGDRAVLTPINNTSLMALVCLQLHRATGKRLWLAKADALITSCLLAQDPASGAVNEELASDFSDHVSAFGWHARNLLEYGRLRADIQPALAVSSASGSFGEKGTTKR